MGLLDFVKDAGQKLFDMTTENNDEKIAALTKAVKEKGYDIEHLTLNFTEGVVSIAGNVPSQAEKEKVVLFLGNAKGVSQVQDMLKVKVDKPEPKAELYTVKSGDSLSAIAKSYYGDPMKYNLIFDANRPMLENPDLIYPGQVLRIPAKEVAIS